MNFLLLGGFANGMLGFLMAFLSLFLIMLILIQRGKGGGLTGALGGPGGQSAFGSKAGDTFTVVTVVVASIWGFTCAFAMWLNVESGGDALDPDQTAAVQEAGVTETGTGTETETETETGEGTSTNTDLVPGLSQGGGLASPNLGEPADTAKPADAPADTAKPADAPADTAKPADAPADTAKPADTPAETAKPADAPADTAKPAEAPAETDSGEAAEASDKK